MKNLTDIFLSSAPSRFRLPFGIIESAILKAASNEVRRDKNGQKVIKNCYITFAMIDPKENNKILAETTYSYFNIDKPVFAVQNFIHQVNQLVEIASAVVPQDFINDVMNNINTILNKDAKLFSNLSDGSVPSTSKTKKIGELQQRVVDAFIENISPYTGSDGDVVSLLAVTGTNGKFQELPREDKGFIAKKGKRKLTLDSKYIMWFDKRNEAEKSTGDDIGSDEIMDEEELLMDDDNLDDI